MNEPANGNDPRGLDSEEGREDFCDLNPDEWYCSETPVGIGGGSGGGVDEMTVITQEFDDAAARASDRITDQDCASLFFTKANNTPQNRVLLSQTFLSFEDRPGGFTYLKPEYAGNVPAGVPVFVNDNNQIELVGGRSFFTGLKDDGKPLDGPFSGLDLNQFQELTLIHEFMHQIGLIGSDDNNQSYKLANGQTVHGSLELSQAIRDHCFH